LGFNTREIVKERNIRLNKSLGQNFLTDETIVNRIVDTANVGKDDLVIEIGPGIGSMTVRLAEKAGQVIAVEIDKHLIPILRDNLKSFDNVRIINKDVLKVSFGKSEEDDIDIKPDDGKFSSVKVVANLPYYITTPIIMKLLENNPGIDTMVFMVQKEVAQRMVAKPGSKDYGALSVAVQYRSDAKIAFDVPPHCFVPQPDVYSTVVRLDILKEPLVKLKDEDLFFKIVKAAFGQRRKTLVNAIYNSGAFSKSKDELAEILHSIGINEKQRGETLSIEQFALLANALS